MVTVLDADPGLRAGLTATALAHARREALAPLLCVSPGMWRWRRVGHDPTGDLGLLVLDGLLTRCEAIGELEYTELLGAGDILRPWAEEPHSTLLTVSSWRVITPARLAHLDRDFAMRVRQWPEIHAALLDRATMRSSSLGVSLVIHRVVRVEERLRLMLLHLANRWGRVTSEGIVLPIPLTHHSLACLIGARRSPVSVALGNLRREGAVHRNPEGWWVLQSDLLERIPCDPDPSPAAES